MQLKTTKKVLIGFIILAFALLFGIPCFAENITYIYDDLNRL